VDLNTDKTAAIFFNEISGLNGSGYYNTGIFFVMTLCSFIGAKLRGGTTQMTTRLIYVLIGNALRRTVA
jgi:hypothetical protein